VFCSGEERRVGKMFAHNKMLGLIRNPENALKMVLKLGSMWDFPVKI
jgi:hypothetical protein